MISHIHFIFTLLFVIVLCDINNVTNISSESPEITHSSDVCENTTSSDVCMLESNVTLSSEEKNATDKNITFFENGSSTAVVNITEEITTPLPTTTTTTEISTSTDTASLLEPPPMFDDVCACDLTVNLCDINCCCDPDCSSGDRAVFSHCDVRISPTRDSRYCYQNLFIYRNNTEYHVEVQHNDMFCIVKDNFPGRFEYLNRKPISSIQQFKKLYRQNKVFPWRLHSSKHGIFSPPKVYKAKQNTWILIGTTVKPFEIPVSIVNSLCQSSRTVLYLVDQSSSCLRKLPTHWSSDPDSFLNATYYFQSFKIIALPFLMTQIKSSGECINDVCIPVIPHLCLGNITDDNLSDCSESETVEPVHYDENLRTWKNVVHKIYYVFTHNGTRGILQVSVYIWLTNAELYQDYISQRYTVSFRWPSDDMKLFRRSGNPGYIIGKPVLAGRKVIKVSEVEGNEEKEEIELSENNKYWLSLPKSCNGKCDLQNKQSLTFGENRRLSCVLTLFMSNFTSDQSCFSLQKYIMQLLVGSSIENVTEPKSLNVFVATFGDSKVEATGDWSQVMLENLPTFVAKSSSKVNDWFAACEGIVKTLHINIAFSYVGTFKNPQAKILGVTLKFGEPENVVFDCGPFRCAGVKNDITRSFELISSVSFIDVSTPAVPHYAEPPVYEIKLPHDFFYPFVSSSVLPYPSSVLVIILFNILLVEIY